MGIYLGDKVIANYYKLPDQTGQAGKALMTDGNEANWGDASSVFKYSSSGQFTKENVVFVDSLDTAIPETSEHSDDIWLYSSPVYPYVPMTGVSDTSWTFENGGMVICYESTNVTISDSVLDRSITFTNFVGILPVSIGTTVTTNKVAIFSGY